MRKKDQHVVVPGDGDPCPRCGRPMQIREHKSITEKHRRQPFHYTRWFRCMNPDCRTTLAMPERFKVLAQEDGMKKKQQDDIGLIGLFGHAYTADPEDAERQTIRHQFQIIRKMDGGRCVVQLFSFMDGGPTNVAVYDERFLLGPDVKLYATAELWNEACERENERERRRTATGSPP